MTGTVIVIEDAPIYHRREDETFTFCQVWLTPPRVFVETDEPPEGMRECNTCKFRWETHQVQQ